MADLIRNVASLIFSEPAALKKDTTAKIHDAGTTV